MSISGIVAGSLSGLLVAGDAAWPYTARGTIAVKGIGEMETWYLLGGLVTAYQAAKRQPRVG